MTDWIGDGVTVSFKAPYAGRIALKEIELRAGINVLVGPNGSGKSSVICAFKEGKVKLHMDENKRGDISGVRTVFWDTEKDNPRLQPTLSEDANNLSVQLGSFFLSHGETLAGLLLKGMKATADENEKALIIIDEPESGLDIDNLLAFCRMMEEAQDGVVWLAATHNPKIIGIADNTIALDPDHVEKVFRAYGMWR